MIELLIIGAMLVLAYLLSRFYREETLRWFTRLRQFRKVFWAAIGIIVGFVFVSSSYPPLMLVGAAIFLYIGLLLIFERPHSQLKEWLLEPL